MKVPLLCQVASLLLLIAVDGADNIQFDPDDDNTVKCTIAPYTDVDNYFKPKVDQCLGISYSGTSSGLDLNSVQHSSIHRLAVAYAPVLFFHPLEKYFLFSVDATFARPTRGNLYQNSGGVHLIEDQLNLNTFLKTSRDPVWALQSSSFFFTLEDYAREMYFSEPDEKFGDGYDEEGKSKAKIYYNVFESGNGTWTFNYWLYYEFNGGKCVLCMCFVFCVSIFTYVYIYLHLFLTKTLFAPLGQRGTWESCPHLLETKPGTPVST